MARMAAAAEKRIELPLVQRLMVEQRVESVRLLPEIFWKPLRVEDTAQPFEADQPVNRRRKIEPGKRLCRRNIEATIANRFDAFPDIFGTRGSEKIRIDGYDNFGVPGQQLFRRHCDDSAGTHAFSSDIACADSFEALHVNRAFETGLESARPSSIVNEGALLGRYLSQALINLGQEPLGVTRQLFGSLTDAQRFSCRDIRAWNLGEATVEQQIRNTGLLLHAVGERYIGRVDHTIVDDHIGTGRQHDLNIGRVAPPR